MPVDNFDPDKIALVTSDLEETVLETTHSREQQEFVPEIAGLRPEAWIAV